MPEPFDPPEVPQSSANSTRGTVSEVAAAFLWLGCTSFGGPIAHVGYFRREFVERRRWLNESQFAQLLAMCQFLPGPASSQLGFSIGLLRAGMRGALTAFVAFTLPSAILLFALSEATFALRSPLGLGMLHGLKLAAVAVVTYAVVRMAHAMTPDGRRVVIAIGVMLTTLVVRAPWMQLAAIGAGGACGLLWVRLPHCDAPVELRVPYGRVVAAIAFVLFASGLTLALVWQTAAPVLGGTFAAFYRAGALVFGGGHVVLPLLEQSVVSTGWVSHDAFLAGYGAAQAVPGPMFSLAAFLGAQVPTGASPLAGAITAALSIFAPGLLLVVAVLPVWSRVASMTRARRAVSGINAAVVGLLAAALIDPVGQAALGTIVDVAIALVALALLWNDRRSALWSVAFCVASAVALQRLSS